ARRIAARLTLGAVLTLGLTAPLSAQETREEEIARLQAEEAANLHTPAPTRAERMTRRILGPPGPVYAWAGTIYSGCRGGVGAGGDGGDPPHAGADARAADPPPAPRTAGSGLCLGWHHLLRRPRRRGRRGGSACRRYRTLHRTRRHLDPRLPAARGGLPLP